MEKSSLVIDVPRLSGTFLVSNTPMYLFRRFREDDSVRRLGVTLRIEDLLELFREHTRAACPSVEDLVVAYAALIALTHKKTTEIHEHLSAFDAPCLPWLAEIKDAIAFSSVITNSAGLSTPLPPATLGADLTNSRVGTSVKTSGPTSVAV